ncbi:MAG: Phenylalanine--tRNA ligase beta subunit [Bacteroidetes bacterium ADurb.Bin234]|nr:MAG: Phenylalanine--tRNA ligase beta subunit [Bacteroidetes bacterium ADurb.Bin234]
MDISYNWLKQYIQTDLQTSRMSEILTAVGLEVEGIRNYETIKGGLEGICIGKILHCEKHPNADRLHITKVDVGETNTLQIVCGASNVAAGQSVLVARIGATLYPAVGDPFTIKKSKIREVVSEGMICAEDELGLGNSHAGILVLPNNPTCGMPAKDYFKIETDTIFEIGLTPNRSDAASHIGVARDIVAYLNTHQTNKHTLQYPKTNAFPKNNPTNPIQITIEDTQACPRYTGLYIANVQVKESPDWLKNRLNAINIRPINNVVDITQYVLFELGQPLHAFDADKIKGNHVIIKKLTEGTPFITLDEIERKLTQNDLMICNANEPMCIAGIMGGKESGISFNTTHVFLESAYFNPVSIRKTSKHHALKTDASFRYERGCDPNITLHAIQRAALLIQELAGGTISTITDQYPNPIKEKEVTLNYQHLNSLIGKQIDKQTVNNVLQALEMKITTKTNDSINVTVPTNKPDVTREADVIEEFLRIYGYNNIEMKNTFTYTPSGLKESPLILLKENISTYLSNNGFNEIINNSLTKSEYAEFDFINKNETVSLLNPLSKDLQNMRQTLLFGGLESIVNNINHANENLRLYEFGTVYAKNPAKTATDNVVERYTHQTKLALFATGKQHKESWQFKAYDLDIFYLKNIILNVLNKNNFIINLFTLQTEPAAGALIHVLTYKYKDEPILSIGEVNKKTLKHFGIKQKVYYAEINCDKLIAINERKKVLFKELNKFPEVERDLALLLDKHITYQEVEKTAFKTEKKLLKSVNLFDVYEGKNLDEGKKSYAVRFILSHPDKTLTNDEINQVMDKLIKAYQKELGASLR